MSTPPASSDPARAGQTRAQSQQRTHDALLEAAERLIIGKSVAGATLRGICSEAGYSQGAFYSNFESREELLLEVMQRHVTKQMNAITTMLEHQDTLEHELRAIAEWLAGSHERENWAMVSIELRMLAARDARFAKALEAAFTKIIDHLALRVTRVTDDYGLTLPGSAQDVALTLMTLWQSTALRREVDGGSVAVYMAMLRALFGAPQPN